jgi:lipopolysaccharide transport system ATP-binding protein
MEYSMSETAIKVENLSKIYKLYNDPKDRFKETFHPLRKKYHHDFYALNDVSFEIQKGETVGIIGQNGSGKSTLLKILTGVLTPSSGNVQVNGRVSALLELGAGFNPELAGIENVYFNGAILGFTKEEMDEKIDDILGFADIGEFVHQPVKTYSSGMFVRLAFSVATQVDPDILIVDEALSVGDMFFQAKCMTRMKKMIENEGTTLLFVSHDTGTVKALCQKGILLKNGSVLFNGESGIAVEKYFNLKVESEQQVIKHTKSDMVTVTENSKSADNSLKKHNDLNNWFIPSDDFLKTSQFERIQNGKAEFKNVVLLDEYENPIKTVEFGQKVKLRMAIEIHEDIHLLGYGYHIRDHNGVDVVYVDNNISGKENFENITKGESYIIDWSFEARLQSGQYSILSVISIPIMLETGQVDFCDLIPISYQFVVNTRRPSPLYGFISWQGETSVIKV